jgi:hypothetical protein
MDLTEEEQLALFTEITAAPETAEEEESAPHDEEKEDESLIDLDF